MNDFSLGTVGGFCLIGFSLGTGGEGGGGVFSALLHANTDLTWVSRRSSDGGGRCAIEVLHREEEGFLASRFIAIYKYVSIVLCWSKLVVLC